MTTFQDLPYFSKANRPFRTYRECPPQTLEKYRDVLPAIVTESWAKSGFQEISNGFLWSVDPDEYRDVIADFIYPDQRERVHVFLRTAFGCMVLEHEGHIVHFSVVSMRHAKLDGTLEATLEMELGQPRLLNSIFFKSVFRKALARLGKPGEDEVYGFEPALPLGGELKPENLRKMNLATHLHFLSQLTGRAE